MEILKNRIKQLRKEKEWSQDYIAKAIGTKANEISRYETGRIIPSVETLAKLAKAFGVTSDYMIMENACRMPLRTEDMTLLAYFEKLQVLNGKDRESIFHMIDAVTTKNKVKSVAQEAG